MAKIIVEMNEVLSIVKKHFEDKGVVLDSLSFRMEYTGKVDNVRVEMEIK